MIRIWIAFGVMTVCSVVAVLVAYDRSAELESVRRAIAAIDAELTLAEAEGLAKDREAARLRSLIAESRRELKESLSSEETNGEGGAKRRSKGSAGELAEEVDHWLDRVDRLAEFLSLHDSLRIPELEFLSARDWLDATNSVALETEADYRMALATLRRQAKQAVAPKIKEALAAYMSENEGVAPTESSQLLPYLDPAVSPAILARYKANPSGELLNVRTPGAKMVLVEENGPDEIWHWRISFGTDGGIGTMGPPGIQNIRETIEAFEKAEGRRPESAEELRPYLPTGAKDEFLDQKLRAAMTPVRLPSER